MKWGILGAGSVAQRRVMPAINALAGQSISALMVRDQSRADALTEENCARTSYASVDDLVRDTEVDAIYVSSPVNLHREHVAAAAASGKHVLCEKPMAMTATECREMISICEKAGVTLGVCFVLRGWEIYQRIGALLSGNQLGTLIDIRAHLAKWTPRESDEWRLDASQSGGGTLVDVATHYLDLFRFLAGEISQIAYMGSSRVFEWPVEETAHAMVAFANGAHGSLTASCTVPHGGNLLEIYGSEGSLFLGRSLRTVTNSGETEEPVQFPDYYTGLLADFAASVSSRRQPIATGRDGLRGMQIVEAAYLSGREGRIVDIG
jgi:predicted dehydrogenase